MVRPTIRSLHRPDDCSHWHFCIACEGGVYCVRRNCVVPEDIPMGRTCENLENDEELDDGTRMDL